MVYTNPKDMAIVISQHPNPISHGGVNLDQMISLCTIKNKILYQLQNKIQNIIMT
jgi:hypothetical protein